MTSRAVRLAALGSVAGPAAFVAAWSAGGAVTDAPYDPVDDAISRLAAVGASTRPLMTAGFVGFGVLVPLGAWALRRVVAGPAWISGTLAGLATLAVAATPLDRSTAIDRWHAVSAAGGYVALAATPLLAARPLLRAGHVGLARLGLVSGATSAVSLVLASSALPTGLFQRIGLTAADAWLVTAGAAIATGRLRGGPGSTP